MSIVKRLAFFGILFLAACGASGTQILNAAINTSIATGAAVSNRNDGECYTWCAEGTQCNPETGLCESIPCGGKCKPGESCDQSGLVDKCIPASSRPDIPTIVDEAN